MKWLRFHKSSRHFLKKKKRNLYHWRIEWPKACKLKFVSKLKKKLAGCAHQPSSTVPSLILPAKCWRIWQSQASCSTCRLTWCASRSSQLCLGLSFYCGSGLKLDSRDSNVRKNGLTKTWTSQLTLERCRKSGDSLNCYLMRSNALCWNTTRGGSWILRKIKVQKRS